MPNQLEAEEVAEVEEGKVTIEDIMSDISVAGVTEADTELIPEEEKQKADILKAKQGTPVWLQKKIDKATLEKKIAIEESRKLREKLAEIETERVVKSKPIPPLESNFDSSELYLEAADKYQDEIFQYNSTKARTKQLAEETELKTKEIEEKFLSNSERMLGKYPDFDEAVDSSDYRGLNKVFIEHELAPEISYYLAKNPEEIKRISALSMAGTGIEIGKLVERFSNAKSKRTNAPKPLNTVNSSTETVITDIDRIENDNDWYKAYKARRIRKLQGKF